MSEKTPPEPIFHVTYTVEHHPEGIRPPFPPDTGAADSMFFCSIMQNPGGSQTFSMFGIDGETGGELSPEQQFKVWVMLANQLAEKFPPDSAGAVLCRTVVELISPIAVKLPATAPGGPRSGGEDTN